MTRVNDGSHSSPATHMCWYMNRKRGQSQRLLLGDWSMPLIHGLSEKSFGSRIPDTLQRFCQGDYRLPSSFQYGIIKTRRLRFCCHVARLDSRQDHHRALLRLPKDWRRPRGRPRTTWLMGNDVVMLMYSRLTSVSTQHGGRSTIVFSGDVSSTQQHSTRDTPLKKKTH